MEKKVQRIINCLLPYQPERLYLFGSWARGEEDELSDIDLVVIKQTSSPFFDRLREATRLLPPDMGGVDILVYTPEEFEKMKEEGNAFAELIAEEGALIYDRQRKSEENSRSSPGKCGQSILDYPEFLPSPRRKRNLGN